MGPARLAGLGLFCTLALIGCSSTDEPRISDYLDQLEFSAPTESITNVSIGRFAVPIPERPAHDQPPPVDLLAQTDAATSEETWTSPAYRLQVKFELVAETTPEFEADVVEAIERRRGLIRDAVLTTCRSISPDELADPRFAVLKSRLSDELRPLLGQGKIRQLVVESYGEQRY